MTTTPANVQRGLLAANAGTRTGHCGAKLASGVSNPTPEDLGGGGASYLDGIVHAWRFDELSGTDRVDHIGAVALTEANGAVDRVAGHVPDDYLSIKTLAASNNALSNQTFDWLPSGDFSMMAWALLTGGNYMDIFRAFYANGSERIGLRWSPFTGIGSAFQATGRFQHLNKEVNVTSTNTNGRWYFVQADFNNATKTLRVRNRDYTVAFDSGWASTGTSLALNLTPSTATYKFVVGGRDYNNVATNCQVDQLVLWERLLTDQEWDDLYNSGTGVAI